MFAIGSLSGKQSQGEKEAANACCSESFSTLGGVVSASSTGQFTRELAQMLGGTGEAVYRSAEELLERVAERKRQMSKEAEERGNRS